ncbi:hypothetical protein [Phytohabitans houttuyneae]
MAVVPPAVRANALPRVQVPVDEFAVELVGFYTTLARRTQLFLTGLAVWDHLTETEQARLSTQLTEATPKAAVRRYNRYVTELAGQFPGFAFWLGAWEHGATRTEVGRLRTALGDLAERLGSQAPAGDAHRRWRQLARRYAADLEKPAIAGQGYGMASSWVPRTHVRRSTLSSTPRPARSRTGRKRTRLPAQPVAAPACRVPSLYVAGARWRAHLVERGPVRHRDGRRDGPPRHDVEPTRPPHHRIPEDRHNNRPRHTGDSPLRRGPVGKARQAPRRRLHLPRRARAERVAQTLHNELVTPRLNRHQAAFAFFARPSARA